MGLLAGKCALITGASAGIGRATAVAFAREGARLILLARRKPRLEALSEELTAAHGALSLAVVADVRDRPALAGALGALPGPWSDIDILVNNAGLSRALDPLPAGDPDDWDEMLDVNVRGLLAVTRLVLPGMLKRGSGHVINLGSIAGHETYPGGAVYCASKFAVRALSGGLKMDLHGTPIRVTCIEPGLVETEFSLVRYKGDPVRAQAPYRGLKPLSGEDIAEAIVWCATRPPHIDVLSLMLVPTAQSSTQMVHRAE